MKKLLKGNEAIAEAAIQAGCRFFFGYPITPQNQIPEYMSKRLPQVGGCFLQAESEVAAINMVYGAAGAGARVMTSSSSPGISLKQEGISYIVGAELPCVIVNMVRGGPGLGGIQPAQSDYYQATRGGGHGDYRMCVLAPSSVQEAVDLTQEAFDIADRYRNPVLVLGDGLIGQMMEPVDMEPRKDRKPAQDLGEKLWAADGHIPTAERPRSVINSLYIDPAVLERHCHKLQAKYDAMAAAECRWQEEQLDDAEIVIVAYGTTSRIARSAMRKCREKGIKVGLLRPITLWPFPESAIRRTLTTAKRYLCVEMSMGQMVDDVRLAVNGERPVDFFGRTGGMVPTVSEIVSKITALSGKSAPDDGCCSFRIDDTIDAVGKAFDDMGKRIGDALSSPELADKAEAAKAKLSDAASSVGQTFADIGRRLGDTIKESGVKEKAEDALHRAGQKIDEVSKQIGDAINRADKDECDYHKPEADEVRDFFGSSEEKKPEEPSADVSADELRDFFGSKSTDGGQSYEAPSETHDDADRHTDGAAQAKDTLEELAGKASHGLAKGAGFIAEGLDKVFGAIKKKIDEQDKGGER